MNKNKIIAKQAELIAHLHDIMSNYDDVDNTDIEIVEELESELSALKSEPEEEMYPASFVQWFADNEPWHGMIKRAFDYWKSNKPK
jgi:molybdopterin converting factor small subunit